MITIVNYGLGNVQAFANIYKRLNIPATVAVTADELAPAEKIILPGVGAFDCAMARLNDSGMRDCLEDLVLRRKRPVLGICVGMQMMASRSDEGTQAGLGWIDGEVKKLAETSSFGKTQLPHMGWNDVCPRETDFLFRGLETGARFYFLHSYYFLPRRTDDVLATTDYHGPFTSAVRSGNVCGVQFHPEKSHEWGIRLLKTFAEL
jgi:imidazole glycerol-phosphate synthase subunit HisH